MMLLKPKIWSNSVRRLYATSTEQPQIKFNKLSRQQKIDNANMTIQLKLYRLDQEFNLFEGVFKVLDLGYVPGNWCQYAKYKLCLLNHVNDSDFHTKFHILGFDILFGTPPPGISTLQGNIYSKLLQTNILNHFKEVALKQYEQDNLTSNSDQENQIDSYYVKEMKESQIDKKIQQLNEEELKSNDQLLNVKVAPDQLKDGDSVKSRIVKSLKTENDGSNISIADRLAEIELAEMINDLKIDEKNDVKDNLDELAVGLTNVSLVDLSEYQKQQVDLKRNQVLQGLSYKPDLILADLFKPFMQQSGFFNNTNSRPYNRFNTTDALNKPITNPAKASIDLNDAALHLACNVLKQGGTFVTRLSQIDSSDPEVEIFENRLKKVFNNVNRRDGDHGCKELFFVARDKKEDNEFDLQHLF